MDHNEYNYDQDKFNAVWRRVMNEPEPAFSKGVQDKYTPDREAARLRTLMDDEANDATYYASLAAMVSGPSRSSLYQISADEKNHLRRLRGYYFILTGDVYTPPCACPLIYRVPNALRQKYMGEGAGSQAYLEAAENTEYSDLSEIYKTLSTDEARHKKIIGCLIEILL